MNGMEPLPILFLAVDILGTQAESLGDRLELLSPEAYSCAQSWALGFSFD